MTAADAADDHRPDDHRPGERQDGEQQDGGVRDGSSHGPVPPLVPGAALVTGAAVRLGAAMAMELAAAGWRVGVHYRGNRRAADALVARIAAAGGTAAALQADLAREADVATLAAAAADRLGPLTLLVNNAATFERDDAATADRASWNAHIEPNLRAPLVLSQALAAGRPAGRAALIVNMLDQRVWNPTPAFLSYTVSKAALWSLTRTLALALAPWIRVVGIGPGPALPNSRQRPDDFARQCDSVPLQTGTGPAEICATLRYLMQTPSLTGQMIALDGGQHLGWTVPAPGTELPE